MSAANLAHLDVWVHSTCLCEKFAMVFRTINTLCVWYASPRPAFHRHINCVDRHDLL